MDITVLPDEVLLKVFDYLPFQERVRSGRVNQQFQKLSSKIISKTTKLDLSQDIFKKLTLEPFEAMLELCAVNLESLVMQGFSFKRNEKADDFVDVFAQFRCPKMIDLNLGGADVARMTFRELLSNNPNLERVLGYSFDWNDHRYFPLNKEHVNLRCLSIHDCSANFIRSMTGYCPNLEEFTVDGVLGGINERILDDFCRSCLNLNRFNLADIDNGEFKLDRMEHIWNLHSIYEFGLASPGDMNTRRLVNDAALKKIVASFPKLKKLSIGNVYATNQAFASLARLQHLEVLNLDWVPEADPNVAEFAIQELVACKSLVCLECNNFVVSSDLIIDLVHSCPKLFDISFKAARDVNSIEVATGFLRTLFMGLNKDLMITFRGAPKRGPYLWARKEIKDAVKQINSNVRQNGGHHKLTVIAL